MCGDFPLDPINKDKLPTSCCKNVAGLGEPFRSCDKPAAYWFKHNEDICSYCFEHRYVCGEEIKNE